MSDYNDFYIRLHPRIQRDFPKTSELLEKGNLKVDWKHLISPLEISIPEKSQQKMVAAVKDLFDLSRMSSSATSNIKNYSVLMSYDFHTNPEGDAKLIEINTNASGFLIASLGIACAEGKSLHDLPQIKSLKESFLLEAGSDKSLTIAIVDDEVSSQKMLIEFYLYKELFEYWGWTAEICEARDLIVKDNQILTPQGLKVDLIYNRTTDFYLEESRHEALQRAWSEQMAVVTPQPQEYALLADKNRLLELQKSKSNLKNSIRQVLLDAYDVKDFSSTEELWSQRKKFFFKPKNSFGGKSAYRGQTLSHKVFDRLIGEDPLIQEHFPAQKQDQWKFDLRCFVYKDQIQFIAGRLYQGQVTNFSTLFGGFCPVRLKS